MSGKSQKQRMRENEAVFRQENERVQKTLKKDLDKSTYYTSNIHFFCECADITCIERVVLSPARYEQIHNQRKQFIVAPGHERPEIEDAVAKNGEYFIVEKFKKPPENPSEPTTSPAAT